MMCICKKDIEIVRVAKDVFCDGLYVSSDVHPCGWDFISFDMILNYEEILKYRFRLSDISNYIYDNHKYEFRTLKEILIECDYKFEFEIN